MNAHPAGCYKDVEDQIAYVKSKGTYKGPARVLVVGASTGFGLASRISLAFGAGAGTIGVSFEKEASATKPGTMGWYNVASFQDIARKQGLIADDLNGDAFSHDIKNQAIEKIQRLFGQVDLVVYSLASPARTNPDNPEQQFRSVLKPLGASYTAKSLNPASGEIKDFTIEPANDDEVAQTIKVMGGEDWLLWTQTLLKAGVLAKGAVTVAYSYIGPEVTSAVYRNGTIGKAKEHLEASAADATKLLSGIGGKAYVSVNKALVTRASAVIPVVPLYMTMLFKIMKQNGTHEGCIEQMQRLYGVKMYGEGRNGLQSVPCDHDGRIRMDDWEMDEKVQAQIAKLWPTITQENVAQFADIDEYNVNFLRLHGFGHPAVDYEADISTLYPIA